VQLYDAVCCTQLAWRCGWCWWRRRYVTIGYCWRMALVTVGPATILDICGTKPVQMTAVFGIVDVILKEHLPQPMHNDNKYRLSQKSKLLILCGHINENWEDRRNKQQQRWWSIVWYFHMKYFCPYFLYVNILWQKAVSVGTIAKQTGTSFQSQNIWRQKILTKYLRWKYHFLCSCSYLFMFLISSQFSLTYLHNINSLLYWATVYFTVFKTSLCYYSTHKIMNCRSTLGTQTQLDMWASLEKNRYLTALPELSETDG